MNLRRGRLACGFGALLIGGCAEPRDRCTGYPAQASSPYVLPWPAGAEFPVLTGNCRDDISTHSDERRYAYDFRMPVGSPITAARGGTVVVVVEDYSDDDHPRMVRKGEHDRLPALGVKELQVPLRSKPAGLSCRPSDHSLQTADRLRE